MSAVQKMSITQGLAELKMLDKRLDTRLEDASFIEVQVKKTCMDPEKFAQEAKADLQSYLALLQRRMLIKQAIVVANATTPVKIGSWEGTIAEAIEHKASISYKKKLLAHMRHEWRTGQELKDKLTEQVSKRLDVLLQSELGKDVKTNPETIEALTSSFKENNKIVVLDPLDLMVKIKALEQEIEEFTTNVDWVLSEVNARTFINVPS